MNTETLKEAKKIEEEIIKLQDIIGSISYRYHCARKDVPNKSFDWMIRMLNKRNENGIQEPKIILFDNDHMHGSDIPVEEELLLMIKGYFENKLKVKQQQFNELK